MPGGWLGLSLGGVVAITGFVSLARRRPLVFVAMLGPPMLLLVLLVATQHNLWPRMFFFAAGFAVVFVVRGMFALFGRPPEPDQPLRMPVGPTRVATGLLAVGALASTLTVAGLRGPKQDFLGAAEWLRERGVPEPSVAAIDLAERPLLEYIGLDAVGVVTLDELRALEERHETVTAVYTLPIHIEAVMPELRDYLEREYRVVHRLPGTLSGGDVVIMERNRVP